MQEKETLQTLKKIEDKVTNCGRCKIKLTEANTGVLGYHPEKKDSECGYCTDCVNRYYKTLSPRIISAILVPNPITEITANNPINSNLFIFI